MWQVSDTQTGAAATHATFEQQSRPARPSTPAAGLATGEVKLAAKCCKGAAGFGGTPG